MILAKVLGPVIATQKNSSWVGRAIFVVQPIDPQQKPSGNSFVALDEVQARIGDIVLVTREGNGCRQILKDEGAPVNSLITGIVDQLTFIKDGS
ncbi:MAG: EutN/CcmL family microcompartment protein [Deltaproteobacteria bacterium]|nr:EutN/CcmL family microcompartment protein [Deltaproteobacteria bacterium]